LTVEDAAKFFDDLQLTEQEAGCGQASLEIRERLRFLTTSDEYYVGPSSSTLSARAQRIQLATSLGSRLVERFTSRRASIGCTAGYSPAENILHDLRDLEIRFWWWSTIPT